MLTSSTICNYKRWAFFQDNSLYRYELLEDMLIRQYGEPLELPKTLNEIIREGRNEKGNFYGA